MNPILNSPYDEPKFHYHTNLDYEQIEQGQQIAVRVISHFGEESIKIITV